MIIMLINGSVFFLDYTIVSVQICKKKKKNDLKTIHQQYPNIIHPLKISAHTEVDPSGGIQLPIF